MIVQYEENCQVQRCSCSCCISSLLGESNTLDSEFYQMPFHVRHLKICIHLSLPRCLVHDAISYHIVDLSGVMGLFWKCHVLPDVRMQHTKPRCHRGKTHCSKSHLGWFFFFPVSLEGLGIRLQKCRYNQKWSNISKYILMLSNLPIFWSVKSPPPF